MGPADLTPSTLAVMVQDLSVAFAGRQVLKNLRLNLAKGKRHIILGHSGAGKTTFLRVFNRLNEYFPHCQTSGVIRLQLGHDWVDIHRDGLAVTELRRRVGMVFQSPNVLPMSVEKNISLPLKLVAGLAAKEIPARVEAALRAAHLWEEVKDRLQGSAPTLSGGQQQRLCLARVLSLDPEILLLDEPTASLDFRAAAKIEELLLELTPRYTIIAVSHSLNQARRLAHQVIIFKDGEVARLVEQEQLRQPEIFQTVVEEIF